VLAPIVMLLGIIVHEAGPRQAVVVIAVDIRELTAIETMKMDIATREGRKAAHARHIGTLGTVVDVFEPHGFSGGRGRH
jgi:hypothetical protein